MKNTLSVSLLVFITIFSLTVDAALYKGLDVDGNVVYSDTPFEDAEKFTPPPISVVDSLEGDVQEKPAEEKLKEFKYLDFDIVSPVNNQTIRNDSDINIVLKLRPGLNTEKNHAIWVLVDGKPVVEKAQSLSLQLGRINRGAHKVQAQVRDEEGAIIVRTRTSIIFVKQTHR